jgi:hypothetical protein
MNKVSEITEEKVHGKFEFAMLVYTAVMVTLTDLLMVSF